MRATLTIILGLLLTAPSAGAERGGKLSAQVRQLIDKQKTAEAKRLVDQALRKNARSSDVHFAKARVLIAEGKISDGVIELNQSIKYDAKNADAYYLLGLMQFTRGRHQEAADAWRMAMKFNPALRHAKDCKCGTIDAILKQYPPRNKSRTK